MTFIIVALYAVAHTFLNFKRPLSEHRIDCCLGNVHVLIANIPCAYSPVDIVFEKKFECFVASCILAFCMKANPTCFHRSYYRLVFFSSVVLQGNYTSADILGLVLLGLMEYVTCD